jgi:hypothetical protein
VRSSSWADGQIKETKVIGGHPVLVESALKALRDWKYESHFRKHGSIGVQISSITQ